MCVESDRCVVSDECGVVSVVWCDEWGCSEWGCGGE